MKNFACYASLLLLALPVHAVTSSVVEKQPTPSTPITHVVSFSHEDVGYADNPYRLRTENRLENMFRALRYCDETATYYYAVRAMTQDKLAGAFSAQVSAKTQGEKQAGSDIPLKEDKSLLGNDGKH